MTTLVHQQSHHSYESHSASYSSSVNVDKVVQSVTNATKRLSQISTNTNNSNKKRKSQNKIGPWKLGRTLGRGSTGRVRLAKNINTGKLAAVKIVPKSNFKKLENPKYKRSESVGSKERLPYGIEREIIIMKLISHPNIMGLYDVWENKNDLYLILEYIEGGELFDYLIKRGKLQEFEAINYFKQIIHGIGYLHQFNICHRDLKPENLLLDFNKNIKIADFGMAALEVREKLLETSCGSPHYASPEIVAGKNYHGAPSDIWSCGIILFALLTGHLPFDDENIRKLLLKVQNGKFIMPHDLSWEAKDLISKMLRVDPSERITIDNILTHPLLTKYPEPSIGDVPSSVNAIQNVGPIESVEKIDKEILKNLIVLFHNCEEHTIISKLLSPNKCPEKMFYYLLMKYRNDHTSSVSSSSNDDDAELTDSRQIPRSTSIVCTTTVDPQTGEKHVSVKRIPNSTSVHSNRSTSRNNKVLSNITNQTGSAKNFKASTSFNKKKTIMNKQVISRTSLNTMTSKVRRTPPNSSNNLHRPSSKPPYQEPPKLKRKLTGLLDLNDFEGEGQPKAATDPSEDKENIDLHSNSIKHSKSFDTKTLINFKQICDDMFSDSKPTTLQDTVIPEEVGRKRNPSQRRAPEPNENPRHSIASDKSSIVLDQEEKALQENAAKEVERRRQSLLLQEKQKAALEKLRKHQSNNDFSNLVTGSRHFTEPVRSSLDPRVNTLLRAKSLATPRPNYGSRNTLNGFNNNTNKVLNKLGIEVIPSPRKLNNGLKTSSSKNLAGYLLTSANNVESPKTGHEIFQDNNDNKKDISLDQFSKQEKEQRNILKPTTSANSFNVSPKRNSVQSSYYKSLLTDIDETKPIKEIKPSVLPEEEFLVKSSISKAQLPNPRFSRFSFGAILSESYAPEADATILNSIHTSAGTVVRKNKKSDTQETTKSLGQLKKSSTTNLLGLGIKMKESIKEDEGRLRSDSKKRVVSTASSRLSGPAAAAFISVNVSESVDEDTNNSNSLQKNAVSDYDSDADFENESDATMLDEIDFTRASTFTRSQEPSTRHRNNTLNLLEADLSNFELISSRTADIGKLNTSRPNMIENSETSNDTLLTHNEVDDEDSATSVTKSIETEKPTRLSDIDKPNLAHGSVKTSHIPVEEESDNESFAIGDNRSDILDQASIANTSIDDNNTFDFDESKHNSKIVEDENTSLKRTRVDTEIFSTMNMNNVRVQTPEVKANTNTTSVNHKVDFIPSLSLGYDTLDDDGQIITNKSGKQDVLRRFSMQPRRPAPKAPGMLEEEVKRPKRLSKIFPNVLNQNNDNQKTGSPVQASKSNWFKKFFQSITTPKIGSQEDTAAVSSKNMFIMDCSLTSSSLFRIIRMQLELKKIEGTIEKVHIDQEFGLINGVIPARYAHGRKLKFNIEIIDLINTSSLHLMKVKGNDKGFKNLVNIVSFIVKNEEEATGSRRSKAYKFSGFQQP
ncbi:serine/threonine-protein kinase HSL1 [Scheffersomyces stipitis CBS 6054]|uniref:non-specific serine/threonine protein kinase n=1 Tax=Scheffersomyces stipitis (strain ATCC 58785 / CBS 6054 / NBRC 10063 / NRRL Y-11545) TaxID=322104 RepID=A3LVN1_PICST|nr:serine/threonine-protein kinase HSL1 [Scheffersomyces stipitis CBS 6054]ABN67150.2 serine/threonine-protein kinase HSL1 [Scheffersomyces stipitis CBS 6054]